MDNIVLTIGAIGILVFLSHVFTAVFNRTRIPDVLFLIAIGIVMGPLLGIVSPDQFGKIGPIFVTITLIVILFEGGLSLKLDTLRSSAGGALALAALCFFLTMGVVAGVAFYLTDLGLIPSLILGAILGSTSEALVIPLSRQLGLRKESQTIVALETSVNDVLSIVITIALSAAQKTGKVEFLSITSTLVA